MKIYELKNIRSRRGNFCLDIERLDLDSGKIYAVVGPNGSGKTSLLNILSFIDSFWQGDVRFEGKSVTKDTVVLSSLRAFTSYLLQDPYLFNMSVYDNVSYGLRIRKVSQQAMRDRMHTVMDRFSISHLAPRFARDLSGGEAQRVALARAFSYEARAYLLDEPTANIDRANVSNIEDLIFSLSRERKATVIFTTHSLSQAYRVSDCIIHMASGKVVEVGYENIFHGNLAIEGDVCWLSVKNGVKIATSQCSSGPATVAIDPRDILLSDKQLHSSALNNFYGTIFKVEERSGSCDVFIDMGVIFCARITRHSFDGLKLNIGKKAWLTFKANAVKVI